jgi:hypothetical protein
MNVMKTTGRTAAAFAFLALFSVEAAAQVPGLTASANGRSVTIDITPVAGSTGHQLAVGTSSGSANVATVNLPLSVTHIVVAAPDGSYFMRVRATAGSILGPFSPEVRVDVTAAPPPPPCTPPPAAPTLSATGASLSVTLNWGAVSGAIGYQVHWSRSPGGTELVENTGATSVSKYVGLPGTFYARVVAATPCGNLTSNEVTFTLANTPGSGPRTPNPAPGTIIPRASLAYANAVITQVANAYSGDFANSCGSHAFLYRLVQALRTIDSRWGLNYVRGWAPRMSDDIIAYNPTDQPDEGAQQIYVYDVISGHCTNRPAPWMQDVTDFTWFGGPGRDSSICANRYCARWTLVPYLSAGFPGDKRE